MAFRHVFWSIRGHMTNLRCRERISRTPQPPSALRSARVPVNLIGSPITYANRLISSPITSQSSAAAHLCVARRLATLLDSVSTCSS
jgi:hypothetical protein